MDAVTILFYGNKTLMDSLNQIPQSLWLTGGACGVWTVKDLVAHMAAAEHMLFDALNSVVNGADIPFLKRMGSLGAGASDILVGEKKDTPADQVLADYTGTYEQVMALAKLMPPETWAKVGTIPWYGEGYSIDDFVVYASYGHKREHSAQLDAFRDAHKT
jgi:hypothetical protein